MTEPKPDENALALPGLEPPERLVTPLELAVRRTLSALSADGGLSEIHAAHMAMALDLADIIGRKKSAGRLSTASNDFRELRELLNDLAPADGGMDPELRAALESWADA